MGKQDFELRVKQLGLIVLGMILILLTKSNYCQPCEGVDLINPLCWIQYATCQMGAGILIGITYVAGISLIIVGAYQLVAGE